MPNIYINKNTKFQCQNGNAVWFKAQNGDLKTSIMGVEILLDDCSLALIGAPRPGQCNLLPDPTTGAPSPCGAVVVTGNRWYNTTNVTVAGKKALNSGCSIRCPRQGIIRPFKPTYKSIKIDDHAKSIEIDINQSNEKSDQVQTENKGIQAEPQSARGHATTEMAGNNVNLNEGVRNEAVKCQENEKYAICNYKSCGQAGQCPYLSTSHEPTETNESKNAKILSENIGREAFDLYVRECGTIATILFGRNTYSIAHHHIVPVNQCFKQFPEIVKLANYFGYDINNALNGICLPTMNQGYDKQTLELRLEIAFTAMEQLGKQWHKGNHSYKLTDIERISKDVDALLISKSIKSYKSYKASVDEYLEMFRGKLVGESKCFARNYDTESKAFCDAMNHICGKIADKLRKFETEPKKSHSFFVSKIAFYYAYYDVLKDYQNIIFGGENNG